MSTCVCPYTKDMRDEARRSMVGTVRARLDLSRGFTQGVPPLGKAHGIYPSRHIVCKMNPKTNVSMHGWFTK